MTFKGLILNRLASQISNSEIKPFEKIYHVPTNSVKFFSTGLSKELAILQNKGFEKREPLLMNEKIQNLIQHWKHGVSIEDTKLIELMMTRIQEAGGVYKGLKNRDDVLTYYQRMDDIYSSVKRSGLETPLQPKSPLSKNPMNGIVLNVDIDSELIFAGRGSHRLAMAISASLDYIPVFFRQIHYESLLSGKWRNRYMFITDQPG
jgi:hypothetical protein